MQGYRYGDWGAPRGMTAKDIVLWERDEYGNRITSMVEDSVLAAIPAHRVRWVMRSRRAARIYRQYGDLEIVCIKQELAADPFGGILVEVATD